VVKAEQSIAENIKISYIGSVEDGKIVSMHGDQEAQENLRQICIREEQKDKFYPYLSCYMKKGETVVCLKEVGVDENKLNSCIADSNKGLKYAQVDFATAAQYGVGGSPTLFLNGSQVNEFDFGGRTAQALKSLLCCGFNSQPSICSQTLSGDEAAVAFSEQYSGGTSSGDSSCGQ
jgi:hypothetical protein